MNKNSKTSKGPAKSAPKRKVVIKDLKAKDAGSVRGGADGAGEKGATLDKQSFCASMRRISEVRLPARTA